MIWSTPSSLAEVVNGHDIILICETHESPERVISSINEYSWWSSYRQTNYHSSGFRGLGGLVSHIRESL